MKTKEKDAAWLLMLRKSNLTNLASLNCFKELKTQEQIESAIQNETLKELTLIEPFTLVTTPIHQFNDNLRVVCDVSFTDHKSHKRYFLLYDSFYIQSKIKEKLKDYPISTHESFKIPTENAITVHFHPSKIEKINLKKNYIEDSFFNTESLSFKLKEKPRLYFTLKDTLEEQLAAYGNFKDTQDFFQHFVVPRTIAYESGLIFQTYFNSVIVPAAALNALTPARFKNSLLPKNPAKQTTTYIYDSHTRSYTFSIYPETLQEAAESFNKSKYISLPANIFQNLFAPKALGEKGLPLLITVLYGYKGGSRPLIQLKTSNWIKYARLNTNRGKLFTCRRFNQRMRYLRRIGIITSFDAMTPAAMKYDKTLKVRLCPASYL